MVAGGGGSGGAGDGGIGECRRFRRPHETEQDPQECFTFHERKKTLRGIYRCLVDCKGPFLHSFIFCDEFNACECSRLSSGQTMPQETLGQSYFKDLPAKPKNESDAQIVCESKLKLQHSLQAELSKSYCLF